VLDALFFQVSLERCPGLIGVWYRVTRPAMKTGPILLLEANTGVLEFGHLCRFHDPPLGCTFSTGPVVPARDLHSSSLSNPEG